MMEQSSIKAPVGCSFYPTLTSGDFTFQHESTRHSTNCLFGLGKNFN